MSYETIRFEREDAIAVITLNRPERLNAWTGQMGVEVVDAVGVANEDNSIGAVVVTGAGRGFCAGADIKDSFKARIDGKTEGGATPAPASRPATDYVSFMRQSKPIVAAVNGVAVGVGVTLMLPFDVIVAAESARFGLAFVKMGVVPELASSHFLVQRVGFGHASELCLTARLYSAAEVQAKGLTNYVVPDDQVMAKSKEIAVQIAANPSRQLRMVKSLLSANGSETSIAEVQRREGEALAECYVSAEHREAVQAFIEKREPDFRSL